MLTIVMLEGIVNDYFETFSKYCFIFCLLYSFSTPEIIAKLKSVTITFGFIFDNKLTKFFWIWQNL